MTRTKPKQKAKTITTPAKKKAKKKRSAGQPTKLTKARIKKIAGFVQDGLTYKHAAIMSGIGESTFYLWKSTAEEVEEKIKLKLKIKPGDLLFIEFLEALKLANVKAEHLYIKRLDKQSKEGSYQATMAVLVNRFGERWKHPNSKMELDHSGTMTFIVKRDDG